MKRSVITVLIVLVGLAWACGNAYAARANRDTEFDLDSVLESKLGEPVGQFRAVPVDLGGI